MRTVQQLSNGHPPAQAVVGELGSLVADTDRHESIFGIPFVGARNSRCRCGSDLVQGGVGGDMVRQADLLHEAIASEIIGIGKGVDEIPGFGDSG